MPTAGLHYQVYLGHETTGDGSALLLAGCSEYFYPLGGGKSQLLSEICEGSQLRKQQLCTVSLI